MTQNTTSNTEQKNALNQKFAQARETGKPVFIEQHTEDCEEPDEDHHIDIVKTFAMPDGSIIATRTHNG